MNGFGKLIENCMISLGCKSVTQFASTIGVPRETVRGWSLGNQPRVLKYQNFLEEKFPEIFKGYNWAQQEENSLIQIEQLPEKIPENVCVDYTCMNKLELLLAKEHVILLNKALSKLVLDMGPADREFFKEMLGEEDWEMLLNLTRSLVSERAREMSFEEGRLERR